MPFIENNNFKPPLLLRNAHAQTLLPHYFRKPLGVRFERERFELSDGDFLDLDWQRSGSKKLVIITHGLEGSSRRFYVRSFAEKLEGFDILAWNMRGCGGELNRLKRLYHSGESADLALVIDKVKDIYDEIFLYGVSIGGNITLKLLGEYGGSLPKALKGAVALSVPCDLQSSAEKMAAFKNRLYMRYFMKSLQSKILHKKKQYPNDIDVSELLSMKTFLEFDNSYTAPLHGFQDAYHYWGECSSKKYISQIKLPTLLISAQNDPFLTKACFPVEEAKQNDNFLFELTKSGGHIGFVERLSPLSSWGERRALEFFNSCT